MSRIWSKSDHKKDLEYPECFQNSEVILELYMLEQIYFQKTSGFIFNFSVNLYIYCKKGTYRAR